MARTRVMHDYVMDGLGSVSKVPKQPLDKVPPPSEEILKDTLGDFEAWKA